MWVREGSDIDIQDAPKTDFVIVGPIDKKSQKTTGIQCWLSGIQWYTVLVVRYTVVYSVGCQWCGCHEGSVIVRPGGL